MKTILEEQSDNTVNKENVKVKAVESIEKLLKRLFLIAFVLLVAAQAMLTNPAIRSSLESEEIEGEPLGKEEYLFVPCKMELKLTNTDCCPELKVLVNGDEYGAFTTDTILLDLKDGDVVELDAGRLLVLAEVRINAVSRNLAQLLGREITAANGIVPVGVACAGDENSNNYRDN